MKQVKKKIGSGEKERFVLSPFRNLDSYKSQQAKIAKDKGVYEELMEARTLTRARKIVYR